MENNLIIGATLSQYKIGAHMEVTIRRQASEPYCVQWIRIIREATREEYIKYHEENGLEYDINPRDYYYAILMD